MKVLFCVHGWPPEQQGGTENAARALALALTRAGHEVCVVAGSTHRSPTEGALAVTVETDEGELKVVRLQRSDLYFDHWQKGRSPEITRALREILRDERPDVVHVHHWIRLSRDLVLCAARAGVPAVVGLHDLWTSCLIAFRLLPDSRAFCKTPIAAHPCIACAGKLAPKTPWVPLESAFLALAERQRDLARELALARVRIVPSRAHARALVSFFADAAQDLAELEVVPPTASTISRSRAPRRSPVQEGRLVLGAWGTLARHKGIDLLLDALAQSSARERVELHLAGEFESPSYQRELECRARGSNVHFHGAFRSGDLGQHPVSDVHAFVSATRAHESYGLVLDEALALGLPRVIPDAPAFVERAGEQGAALFYESAHSGELARTLDRLSTETDLWPRLAREAGAARERLPTIADVAERHAELYARAIALGAPEVEPAAWFEERMDRAALAEWDRALAQRSAAELGLRLEEPRP